MRMEIRPGEGGADAELFAHQLAQSIAKHSNKEIISEGTTRILERL